MEKRIEKLEEFAADANERLVRIETRVDGISANMATKADISSTKADVAALEMPEMVYWHFDSAFRARFRHSTISEIEPPILEDSLPLIHPSNSSSARAEWTIRLWH